MLISNILRMLLVMLVAVTGSAGLAADEGDRVTVEFAEPDRYLDAGNRKRDHDRNLSRIEEFLVTEIGACLDAGERASVRVLDVDLAGRYEWWHRPEGLRIMRDIDWPRLKLEYTRQDAAGESVDEGREWVSDMDYLQRGARRPTTRALAYEQRMIRDWARKRFCGDG